MLSRVSPKSLIHRAAVTTGPGMTPMKAEFTATARLAPAWGLLVCGTVGSLLFTVTYLIEGAIRPAYDPLAQPISALSLGPGGWLQRVDFVVFGAATAVSALGWRWALRGGRAALAYPLLRLAAGLALIIDGLFSQDPGPGYPAATASGAPTLAGQIHLLFAFVAITAFASGCAVLAWRFSAEPAWRNWAVPTAVDGLLTVAFIAAFGALGAHGGITGLLERLAGGVQTALYVAVLARLWASRRRGRR